MNFYKKVKLFSNQLQQILVDVNNQLCQQTNQMNAFRSDIFIAENLKLGVYKMRSTMIHSMK